MPIKHISKSAIDKAGNILAKEKFQTYEEWESSDAIFDEFRQAHLQPLTSTTIALQNWFRADNASYIIVQRLKRKPQILRKLKRLNTRLTQLQDIGGLRVIVDQNSDVDKLIEYITSKLKQQTSIVVKRIVDYREKGRDDSGYRAAHIVMERDGVFLELQIRSRIQHYWAELIERTSVIYGYVIKELEGDRRVINYFKDLSNLFYLIETGQQPDSSQKIDIERSRIEAETIINESDTKNILSGYVNEGIVKTLVDKEKRTGESNFNNWIFIFNWNQGIFVDWTNVSLNPDEAIKSYVEYENKYPADKGFEVVLVGTSSVANVRETHSHYFGLAQQSNILETLNESIVGFSNQMDIDVGARQILQTMERRRYWGRKSVSIDTLKNHYCQDILTFESSLNTLIERELVCKPSNKGVSLNIKKKGDILSYL
ncbi:RelA/SpoT domain-containing protein [Alistipes indistinctus]|uniref:RelA/SpoT domain-containing protein n=1 Tax=Alistipes indistinctus TaxID=626932 RepID=UPI00242AA043|nr:RelA/SpoT domain-containing protein [Alistipes indistinctus]